MVEFKDCFWDSSVTKRIAWQFPYLAIFKDTSSDISDATRVVSAKADYRWVTPYLPHNNVPTKCTLNDDALYSVLGDGMACNHPLRRVVFY